MKKIVILGAGGFAKEVLSFLKLIGKYEVIGFIDADKSLHGKFINNVPVLGDDTKLKMLRKKNIQFAFVAIGGMDNVGLRERLFKKICSLEFDTVNIIHPSAVLAADISIGKGVVIYPNVTINTNVKIGNSVLINSNVTIGHDVEIADFASINPGVNISGGVKIEESAFLGIGCQVIENITVGSKSIIGGGAFVREDVKSATTVVGVPARLIKVHLIRE